MTKRASTRPITDKQAVWDLLAEMRDAAERCDPSHAPPPVETLTFEGVDDDAGIWIAEFADGSRCYVSASKPRAASV